MSRSLDEIVTTFLLNTCALRPQISRHAVEAVMYCVTLTTERLLSLGEQDADFIPLTTGSVAEFYIELMLPHIGDDVMHHFSSLLAIPRGHPLPTQLPAEFSDYVRVLEIVDSRFPGYVYLELCYLLTYSTDDDKYNCFKDDNAHYLSNGSFTEGGSRTRHGPAMLTDHSHTAFLSVDAVWCVRCLSWPPQAADW